MRRLSVRCKLLRHLPAVAASSNLWDVVLREVRMSQPIVFADVLDAAEQLDTDAQAELVAVLSRRLAERGRERVAATVAQARADFAAGQCREITAAELVAGVRRRP